MKKFLFVIFINFIFTINAFAFFSPLYRCEVDGVYRTIDIGEMSEVTGRISSSGIYISDKTKSAYHLLEVVYKSKYISYNLNWTINKKSLVVNVWVSKETDDRFPKNKQIKDALTSVGSATGLCKKM